MSARGKAVSELTALLRKAGQPSKKVWWERYLKNEIEFFGTPMADIRKCLSSWMEHRTGERRLDSTELREISWDMFRQPIAEQKLCAILLLQEHLLPIGEIKAERDLPVIAGLFDAHHIRDWNTTDWLCMRVLGPLVKEKGRPVADILITWVDGPTLWRKRAAVVSFVPIASKCDEAFEGAADDILSVASFLVADERRFAQTGVGWVLRELSDCDSTKVWDFITAHRCQMSAEAIRMAAARLSDPRRKKLGITGKRRRR